MIQKTAVLAITMAQVADNPSALYAYGPLGIITCWLMYRDERRAIQIRENEVREAGHREDVMHRIDGLTKALLVDLVERETATQHAKDFAREAIARIDARGNSKK